MSGPFPSDIAALAFQIAIILFVVTELVGSILIPAIRRRGTAVRRRDRGSGFFMVASVFLVIILAFAFAGNGIAMLPGYVSLAGSLVICAGIVIRQWAVAVLGRYFSPIVGIQEGQTVVRRGPYRFIRHPSYTGALLVLVGVGLALQSWGAILVAIVIFALAYGNRIRLEEKVLATELGDAYVQYMKTTKRLIPFLI